MWEKTSRKFKLQFNFITCFITIIAFGIGCFLGSLTGQWCDIDCCDKILSRDLIHSKYLTRSFHPQAKSISTVLFVIIFSSPNNIDRRNAIRSTWLNTKSDKEILYFFVIGTAALSAAQHKNLQQENFKFGDLLFLSEVKDHYKKLTSKLLYTMVWLDGNVNFKYVLKVDDDSFARLDSIYNQLSQKNMQHRLYWGFFDGRARVKHQGQWNENNWFLCDYYVPYARGGGYVVSSDLVHLIAINSNYLQLYNSEDVSMGVWLASFDIERVHDPNFDTEFQSRGCFNSYLITHKQTIEQMQEKYKNLEQMGQICSNEFRKRLSYIYNWKVPPSLCCVRNDNSIP